MALKVHNFGSDKQLFVINDFIKSTTAEVRMGSLIPRGVIMECDKDYEAGGVVYIQVFKDGDIYKMFYKGTPSFHNTEDTYGMLCYAESRDGINWERKNLGLVEYNGSKDNNIILTSQMLFGGDNSFIEKYCETLEAAKYLPREKWISSLTTADSKNLDTFTICMDTNPDCPPDEKFKAFSPLRRAYNYDMNEVPVPPVANRAKWKGVLYAFKSPDGIHWERLQDDPVMGFGAYDSMNLSFWDEERKQYWAYVRGFHTGYKADGRETNIRDVRWCVSKDYRNWTEGEVITFADGKDVPLYTSAAQQYPLAPNYFIGFPTRYIDRGSWSTSYDYLPDPEMRRDRMETQEPREGTAITDCSMMASRDGKLWYSFDETLMRPGIYRLGAWVYGDCYPAVPIIETPCEDDPTAPPELSMIVTERSRVDGKARLCRFSIRQDGFASLHSTITPTETITDAFVFNGNTLSINFSTSAAGWIKLELQDADGNPLPGYPLEVCDEIFGDTLSRPVLWNGKADLAALSGQTVRMRIVMSDADLYAFQFHY